MAISISALTLDFRGSGMIDTARERASDAVAPLRDAANTVFGPVERVWQGVVGYRKLERENRDLRSQIDALRGDALRGSAAAQRMHELLDLLKLLDASTVPTIAADVIGSPPSNFEQTVQLSKGASAGIRIGDAVVTAAGLVGRIAQVSATRSVVRLVTDPNFSVGVSVPGDQGLASGQGEGRGMKVRLIEARDAQVKAGDTVTTSGEEYGSLLPKGIEIGRVSDVRKIAGSLYLEVDVTPQADLHDLDVVAVLLSRPG